MTLQVASDLYENLPDAIRYLSDFDLLRWHGNLAEGASTPYLYVAEAGTVFAGHIEHNLLPSVNVVVAGSGSKTWVVIPHNQLDDMQTLLNQHGMSLAERNVVITPAMLQERGIQHHTIRQCKGICITIDCASCTALLNSV